MGKRTGKPPGRPAGSKSRATIEAEAIREAVKAVKIATLTGDITPLEVLLGSMRRAWDAGDQKTACLIAKDAAPYVHPRLAATEVTGKDGGAVKFENVTDEDRVAALAAFMARTGRALPNPKETEH